jgi:hypothetical protein
MTTLNPEYNPEWQTIHDEHDAKRTRINKQRQHIQEQMDALFEQRIDYEDPAYQALRTQDENLSKKWDFHHQACLKSFRMQHRTIQEYAEWVFRNFDPSLSFVKGVHRQFPDIKSLTSLEQVNQEYIRILEQKEHDQAQILDSMQTGRPDELDIFELNGNNKIETRHVVFSGPFLRNVSCFMTVDKRDDAIHVCFTHDHHHKGQSAINAIEHIATQLLKHFNSISDQPTLEATTQNRALKLFDTIKKTFSSAGTPTQAFSNYRPEQMHFYSHVPAHRNARESFSLVIMDFENGQYVRPDWRSYKVIPELIQNSYRKMGEPENGEYEVHQPLLIAPGQKP